MRDHDFMQKSNAAEKCRQNCQYKSAIQHYEQALEMLPEHTMVLAYNLGAMYQTELGYGDKAKACYMKVIEWHNAQPNYYQNDPRARIKLDTILANAYENLSLLSDSFEEIYQWAEKVWEINPNEEALRENIRDIRKAQERGIRWALVYFETSQLFWNAEPSKDRGLYGFGASIYRRLLQNRRSFRLDRQLYEFCANGYGGLMLKIVGNIGKNMEAKLGRVEVNEVAFIIEDAITILREYLSVNQHDDRVRNCVGHLEETLTRMKQGIGKPKVPSKPRVRTASHDSASIFTLIGSIVGLVIIKILKVKFGILNAWGYYILGFFGGGFIGNMFAIGLRASKSQETATSEKLGHDGKTQFEIDVSNLEWQKGKDLLITARDIGFDNLTCKLAQVIVNPREVSLDLFFIPESQYQQDLRHQIGLGLRCAVARTLGIVAAATNNVFVAEPVMEYSINLGTGLRAEAFSLMFENIAVGPLQTTSMELADKWLVQIKPMLINMDRHQETTRNLIFILSKLIPTFERMKNLRIRF